MIEIKIHEFKEILDKVYERLLKDVKNGVLLKHDYYLNISGAECFDVEKEIAPSIGSLYDDWTSLKKVIDKENIITYVDFDRLSAILKAISHELNPPIGSDV